MRHGLVALALFTFALGGFVRAEEGQMSRQTMSRLGLGGLQTSQHTTPQPELLPLPQPQPTVHVVPTAPPPIFGWRQLYILNHPPGHPRTNLGRTSVRIANRGFRF